MLKFPSLMPASHYRDPALQFDGVQLQTGPVTSAHAPKRAQRDRYYTAARRLHWRQVMRRVYAR